MKQIIKILVKISIFSLILSLLFFIVNTFASSGDITKINTSPNNNANYKKIIVKPLSNVAVAISTNIGLGLNNKGIISETSVNNKLYSVDDFYLESENVKKGLIRTNMIFTKEYFNIMKMDFKSVLKKSKNKAKTLNNLVNQLKIRLTNANSNLQTLYKQKSLLITEYEKITTQIETLKRKLEKNFNENKSDLVFKNVDDYYNLKHKQIILKTNIIFINNFIRKYAILNKYNQELLNTLTLNKDIISKDSYLVIPNSGTKILEEFELIKTEDEFKNKK